MDSSNTFLKQGIIKPSPDVNKHIAEEHSCQCSRQMFSNRTKSQLLGTYQIV